MNRDSAPSCYFTHGMSDDKLLAALERVRNLGGHDARGRAGHDRLVRGHELVDLTPDLALQIQALGHVLLDEEGVLKKKCKK